MTNYRISAMGSRLEVYIYGEIGLDFSARNFVADIGALEAATEIGIHINSPGGNVFEGLAIYNILKRLSARKTVYIDGLAASMASIIAAAGDEIVMPENAMLMIHDPIGTAFDARSSDLTALAQSLENIRLSMARIYEGRSGIEIAEIERMMAAETWLTAQEAVAMGFADRMETPMKIAAFFNLAQYKHAPESISATNRKESFMPKASTPPKAEDLMQPETQICTCQPVEPPPVTDNPDVQDPEMPTGASASVKGRANMQISAAVASERKRGIEIRAMAEAAGISAKIAEQMIESGLSVAAAREQMFEILAEKSRGHNIRSAHAMTEERAPLTAPIDDVKAAEAQWQQEWNRDEGLRVEFGQFKAFAAYKKAEARGQIGNHAKAAR